MQLGRYLRKLKMMPYISIILIVWNVILFLICTFTGEMLYNEGGLSPAACLDDGQYYRLITAMFLHADIQHLLNNMVLLGGLGAMLEPETGHTGFGILYFLSGLGGQIVSLIYKMFSGEWYVVSIGASGAVFGLVGVLLAISLCGLRKMPNVTWQRILIVVAYSLYSGVQAADIDNAAHIGGFLAGAVSGLVMCFWHRLFGKGTRKNFQ
ncbi:MAG: rhomboid family intramembrane serine protease [Lachnospiraceae bacterium]|nr:rhomboid family intramembrane serine protease [Lachnospiraceae bacterium]